MPLYDFRCETCGEVEEVLLSKLTNILTCRRCGNMSIRKVSSPAVIKVKGSWNSPRGRWARDWTPSSPRFHTGSLHGEKY